MRRLILCGTLIVGVLATRHAAAQYVQPPVDSNDQAPPSERFSKTLRGPVSSHGVARKAPQTPPAGPPAQPPVAADRDQRGHGDRHAHYRHPDHRGQGGWIVGGFPWIWNGGYAPALVPYYPSYSYFGYNVTTPIVVSNPLPVNVAPPAPVAPAANPPAPNNAAANNAAANPAPAKSKATNAEQKARAGRFITFGDTNFAAQRYLAALERYKTAAETAPDVAESYFRQAFAQVAVGQYDSAAAAFRRGLRIRADWSGSPFRLDQLYDNAPLVKTQHIENLAKAVEANPLDADVLLVLGMELFFDGQADRAGVFFDRAAQLGGNLDHLLDAFLAKPKPADAADPPAGGKLVF